MIPMTEKVCQLYKEEQIGKTREGRKAVPANKMPELGWDIAEILEIQEKRQKTHDTPLALRTSVAIIIIISIIIRLSTTQLGKLAVFLREAVITTIGISRNVYKQTMKRLHNTTIAAIAIATSTMNSIDRDTMNPNNDGNGHTSVNSRKPNDEYDYSYQSHPQGGAVPTATNTTNYKKPTRIDTLQLGVTVITRNTMQLKESTSKTQMTSRNNCNNN